MENSHKIAPEPRGSAVELSGRAGGSRRQLEAVANNATLALFIMDEYQHCTYMNPAAEALTGFTLAEVQGRALHDIIHHTRPDGTPYPLEECPIDQAFPKNMREQGEEVFVHKDGSFYAVAFTASPIRDGERTVGTIIEVRDVTEEKRAAGERERLFADRERLLRELEVERARLHQIFEHAPAVISVTRGPQHVFELVNPFYQKMVGDRSLVGKSLREALPELADQGYFEMRDALYASGETHVQKEARVLADLNGDGQREERFLDYVTQPLQNADGEVDGILTFAVDVTEQVHARTLVEEQASEMEAQAEELQHQATQLQAIQVELEGSNDEFQRVNRELAARVEEAERAYATAERAADWSRRLQVVAATPENVAEVCVRHGISALGADAGSLGVLVNEGAEFEVVYTTGYPADVEERWRRFPVNPGKPLSDAVLSRGPVLIETVAEWEARYPSAVADRRYSGTGAFAATPLMVGRRILAGLAFSFHSPQSFDEGERLFLATLGEQAAQALERARLYEAERNARAVAERLQDLTAALSGALFTEDVGRAAMRHGIAAIGADAGVLALLTPAADEVEIVASTGYPPEACMGQGRRWALGMSIPLAEAARTGQSVCIGSSEEWAARYTGSNGPAGGRSAAWCAVPITVEGRAIGALLWTYSGPRWFTSEEVALMETLARLCSQALERVRLIETEQRARAEAEKANRSKTEFLSAMSHELRTPLNAIAGYVDLLDAGVRGPITDVQRADLQRIKRAQEILLSLINDVLNFARLEAGHLEIARTEVCVRGILHELEDLIGNQVRSRGLSYHYTAPPSELKILGDAERIRQILLNLLSNAAKFTDSGGSVSVTAEDNGDHVLIRVSDTGRGISDDKLEGIFEPFVQIDRARIQDSQQGVGLGLAISRELARAMEGDLTAESKLGEGSTFTLVLASSVRPMNECVVADGEGA